MHPTIGDADRKESTCNAENLGSIPGSGRSPQEGNGWLLTPVFLPGEFHGHRSLGSGLRSMGVTKSGTRLSD